jgi:hypothetical protein
LGRAFAGSQRQIQYYVNEHRSVLNQAIRDAFKTSFSLRWVSPLSSDGYREYWDDAFLKALGLSQHCKELNDFWPSGGPHWDALAGRRFQLRVLFLADFETDGFRAQRRLHHVPASSLAITAETSSRA